MLNNMLLNNQRFSEEVREEIKKKNFRPMKTNIQSNPK